MDIEHLQSAEEGPVEALYFYPHNYSQTSTGAQQRASPVTAA